MAFDFAPDRTGPPPVGIRRLPFLGGGIPEVGPGHRATIVEISNSTTAPIESFVDLEQAITRILCEGGVDATYFYFSGHAPFQPKIDLAQLSGQPSVFAISGSSAVDLPLSLGEISRAKVDGALPSGWLAAAVTSGLSAGEIPSLSLCRRAIYERQSVLTETQATALKRQLRVLLADEEELQSAKISVSVLSLHRLIDFLSEHQTSSLPSLSITQAGYFAASWSPRKRAKLTVVFRPEGAADWIASDLNAIPPVHQKDALANRLGEFAAWANA
jgi:hypothetical protein